MTKSHGHTRGAKNSRTYRIWTNMKTRCSNPKASNFEWYGGRGITFDSAWTSFEQFLADMGEAPDGRTLDRKDVSGPYSRDNCRWATWVEQQNNRRANRVLEYKGQQLTLSELARMAGLSAGTIWSRLERGLSAEDAADTPVRRTCEHGNQTRCHECKLLREAARRRAKGIRELSPPTCPKGHVFTPETTKFNNGWRACRICAREYMRAYNAKKKLRQPELNRKEPA